MIAQVAGQDQILVSYPHHVKAYHPEDGRVLWQCDGLGNLVYTTPVVGRGLAVAMGGYMGPAIALKLGGSGNVTDGNVLWRVQRNPQRIGTGILLGENMFMANERGTVECFEAATGGRRWEGRLPTGGRLWSSLIHADGRLYVTTQSGTTVVFAANPEQFEVLSVNPIDETTNSTIAISNGQIFLRTWEALYCIEE
jgi:outer membrane protein assembly factor BamB